METQTDKPRMTVSQNTQNFIDVLIMMQSLYSECYNAIEAVYGKQRADLYMDGDVFTKWQELRDVVFKYLNQSIEYNCSCVGSTEI